MKQEFVRICKKPFIAQNKDRSEQGLKTYSVFGTESGYVTKDLWDDIVLFQTYKQSPQGKAELEDVREKLANGGDINDTKTPLLNYLMKRSGNSKFWQFNMLQDNPEENREASNYLRNYAILNKVELYVWSPAHEEEVKELQMQCEVLNEKNTKT